jgi:hypothetical protein
LGYSATFEAWLAVPAVETIRLRSPTAATGPLKDFEKIA